MTYQVRGVVHKKLGMAAYRAHKTLRPIFEHCGSREHGNIWVDVEGRLNIVNKLHHLEGDMEVTSSQGLVGSRLRLVRMHSHHAWIVFSLLLQSLSTAAVFHAHRTVVVEESKWWQMVVVKP